MNQMRVFESEQFGRVRAVTVDGEPWFCGKDILTALEYSENSDISSVLSKIPEQWKGPKRFGTPGGEQKMLSISEQGLYFFLARSDKPKALPFQMWLAGEVVPSIRKNGGYIAGQETLTDAELMAKAVLVAQKTIQDRDARIRELETQMEADAPKVLFADAVSASDTSILIGELAKLLKQNGVENMGQNRLFAWLRANGYLIQRKGTDFNMPTQRSMEMGLFQVKETAITHSDGHVTVSKTPKITGRGQEYFVSRFLTPEEGKRKRPAR